MVQEKWQTISLVLNDLYFWPFVAGPIWTGVYVCLYSSTLYGILHVLIAPVNIFLDLKDFKQYTSCCNSVLFISFFFLLVNWVPHSFVMYIVRLYLGHVWSPGNTCFLGDIHRPVSVSWCLVGGGQDPW